jgi:hypothetical protein
LAWAIVRLLLCPRARREQRDRKCDENENQKTLTRFRLCFWGIPAPV